MKRLLLVLSTVAAVALFGYFLLPHPRVAEFPDTPQQMPGRAAAPTSTTHREADDQARTPHT